MLLAQETTGTVRGTVLDPSGAAVPSAKVELSGASLPQGLTTTADSAGVFRFAAVPPGPGYIISASAAGFRNSRVGNVNVQLGQATTIELKLEVGQITETVEVAASAVLVDTQSSSSAVTVDKSFFDLLPKGRSYYDLIAIAPGARNEGKAGGFEVDGASGSENTYYLDGMEVTSIQTGVLSAQNRVPVEMVQQLQVKNGVMEAQYGGAMGGVVNAVIRSGSNSFHGQAGLYFNNDAMQARLRPSLQTSLADDNVAEYFQNPMDSYKVWNPVFNLGGPLWKDKIFFFTGYAPTITNTERTVDFSTGQNGTYTRREVQQYLSNKIDVVPFSKLRMNVGWIWNPNRNTGVLPARNGSDSFDSPWAGQGNRRSGNILSGTIDYVASSKLIFSFRGGYAVTNNNTNYAIPNTTAVYYSNANQDPAKFPGIPDSLRFKSGWVSSAVGLTQYDRYPRVNYNADASYMFNLGGQHNLKGGWQMNQLGNDVFLSSYPNGYYRYYWNLTYKCVTSQCTTGAGAFGYYRYRIFSTVGNVSSNNQALFVQDNWRVNKRLTLNLGLRTEREFVPSFASDKSIPSKAITFSWGQKLSPRLGGAFDVLGDGKQRIYASFGWFYDIMKYELPRGSFGGDVYQDYFYTMDDPTLVTKNQGYAADPRKLPGKFLEFVDWRIPSNDPSQHLIEPNLKPMKQRMLDLGYDYSISPTLVASARYTNRRLVRTIEDTGFMSPDGEMYIIGNPGEGILGDKTTWQAQWGAGIPLPPKPVRKYDAVEFRLDKRFSSRYQFAASYTYSRQWGNYSGLASSDEVTSGVGRTSPNVNRYYDEPWVGVTEKGTYAYGRLATDRPHTFKLFGGYTLKSLLGDTTFSPIVSWYSGTPITTEAAIISTTPGFPFGRGDLGRTPMFFNTDFNVLHEVAPFRAHEEMRVRFEFSVFNLFNSATVTNKSSVLLNGNDGQLQFNDANGDPNYAAVFAGFNTRTLMTAQGIRQDPRYGMANGFQSPRETRVQISFTF